MRVQSLGREGPLEKEMATHSVFLPGKSHGERSLAGHSLQCHQESDTTVRAHTPTNVLLHIYLCKTGSEQQRAEKGLGVPVAETRAPTAGRLGLTSGLS